MKEKQMKKVNVKRAGIILFWFILFIIFIKSIDSTIVGVSPPEISFNNVLRNGYAERNLVISIDSIEPINVEITTRGEISDWLNFSKKSFEVRKDKPYSLKVSVTPPVDTPSGNYSGFITIKTGSLGEGVPGGAVGVIRSAVEPHIKVNVVDYEIRDCIATKFKVDSVEKGDDIVFSLNIVNNGNIRLKPKIVVDIWDKDQISIVKTQEFQKQEILPSIEDTFDIRVNTKDLDIGQYFVEVSVPECYSTSTLTFDVLEIGALKSDGVLTSILIPREINLGDTTQIIANFKNTGEKAVEAQFKGKVTRGGKIIQVLESEKLLVPVGEVNNFNFYFTPKDLGKHIILGRVYYSNKKTFELSTGFDVIGKKSPISLFIIVIYSVLLFLIVILFYKINKERRSIKNKLSRLK